MKLKQSLNDLFFITAMSYFIGSFDRRIECVVCCGEVWVHPVMVRVVHLCDCGILVYPFTHCNRLREHAVQPGCKATFLRH